jgi:hypothetical protein
MDRFVKAALLSGLVFPGVGQWYLGRRLRALLFIVPAAAAAWYFASRAWSLVEQIEAEVLSGRVGLDPIAIAERVHQQSAGSTAMMNWAALAMLACWIGSVADALIRKDGAAPEN